MTFAERFNHFRLLKSSTWITPVILSVLVLGCASSTENRSKTDAPLPFVFRKLELEQKKSSGDIDWKLSSPEARYELTRRLVRAKRPVGVLYNKNKPSFEIKADFAVVINDGEQIMLEGDVQLQQINGQKILIKGERLRWEPELSRLIMEQQPRAFDDRSRITATLAILQQDTNSLTLSGPVQLDRWQDKLALTFKPDTAVRTGQATWNLEDGSLKANGPVLGQRRDQEGVVLEQLEGRELIGNTQKGLITVKSPVIVTMPKNKGLLRAKDTNWNFRKQTLSSNDPFEGLINQTQINGESFLAELNQSSVVIPEGCRIQQPGEQLQARQCRWNWETDEVLATGGVRVERESNNQITEAETLSGSVGDEGSFTFTAPGNKVRSQVTIEEETNDRDPNTKTSQPPVLF
ncbi:LPS export ABC transporter periplasmic protein LptC [Synechococcus sp. ROS8604]|uniref:LPS export ABC transporter periplasmic protein LptC n=1 Tax=Synechococcus sp. ROS8604 TaxID=1442557 RepID=UPI0016472AD1|nr:LPS export ABC transporter periplasmic protein LptC [Synechococcus sp. ROS8604]QNI88329.1 LptC-related/ lipopolysaccharide assembly protein [Synechococcus sp. ROS8604]